MLNSGSNKYIPVRKNMANIQSLYSDSQCLSFLRDKEKEKATDREKKEEEEEEEEGKKETKDYIWSLENDLRDYINYKIVFSHSL